MSPLATTTYNRRHASPRNHQYFHPKNPESYFDDFSFTQKIVTSTRASSINQRDLIGIKTTRGRPMGVDSIRMEDCQYLRTAEGGHRQSFVTENARASTVDNNAYRPPNLGRTMPT